MAKDKHKKKLKIIEVTEINLTEKDIISIKKKRDFDEVQRSVFKDTFAFNLNGVYYLIGSEVAYIYNFLCFSFHIF